MTTRLTLFDSPLFLGFDQFEKTVDRLRKAGSDGYPPYNIEQIGENGLRITLAVAGFGLEDLDVEIEHNQLTISGQKTEDESRVYLHRGIASRRFQRAFVLADGIEVVDADLDNGLLHINLQRIQPEPAAQKVRIRSSENQSRKVRTIDLDPAEEQE